MNFLVIKAAVARQFEAIQQNDLFRANVSKDALWDAYQKAFPPGTNEKFRERPQHECACCKQFIGQIGNVVAFVNGVKTCIWDINIPAEPVYQEVAAALSKLVLEADVADVFYHIKPAKGAATAGTDSNIEDVGGIMRTWEHFFAHVKDTHLLPEDAIGTALNLQRNKKAVLLKGMREITNDSIDTVLDLIAQNSLHRGKEREDELLAYRELKNEFNKLNQDQEEGWAWVASRKVHDALAALGKSSMGDLLVDLSNEEDLEAAVRKYEFKVGEGYQRTDSVVTAAMKKRAETDVEAMGLTSALRRRHANLADITVRNVLHANRSTKSKLAGSAFDAIPTKVKQPSLDRVEDVTIEQFLEHILPRAETVEVFMKNEHVAQLMSLTTAVDPTAKSLFKWDNNFAWAYYGDVAVSIKEKVKAAGGNIEGDLCCRLAWDYTDDLDLHMIEPDGTHIHFNNRNSRAGGHLDIDANGQDGIKANPVENIYYQSQSKMQEGVYTLFVHNYTRRDSTKRGFEAEIDFMGQVTKFVYEGVVRAQKDEIIVAKFQYTRSKGIKFLEQLPSVPGIQQARTEWGVTTQNWHTVNAVMLSPNYWDGHKVGNKQWFFMLDKCLNPDPVRGYYNEFLAADLREHRKTFEILGAVTKSPYADEQLSGIGFSETQRASIQCRVTGSFTRVVNIVF